MQRCSIGVKMFRCRGAEVQRFRGAEMQICRGVDLQRCRDVQRCAEMCREEMQWRCSIGVGCRDVEVQSAEVRSAGCRAGAEVMLCSCAEMQRCSIDVEM